MLSRKIKRMPECKKKKEKNNSIVVMSVLYTKGEKNVNRKCDFCKRKNKRRDLMKIEYLANQ